MKLSLYTLALTLLLLFLADTTITWRPFSISFGRGWLVLGMILISIGATMIYYQGRWNGLKRGAEIKKEVIEELKQQETINESI
jgi:hypothetical protein